VKRFHLLAILIGAVAAEVANRLLSFGPLTAAWYAHQPTSGLLYWGLSLIAIALAGGIGGFVAMRISRSGGFVAPLAAGLLYALVNLSRFVFGAGYSWAWWMTAAYLLLTVLAAVLGGRLASRAGLTTAST
jgi:hypothetical protein